MQMQTFKDTFVLPHVYTWYIDLCTLCMYLYMYKYLGICSMLLTKHICNVSQSF